MIPIVIDRLRIHETVAFAVNGRLKMNGAWMFWTWPINNVNMYDGADEDSNCYKHYYR